MKELFLHHNLSIDDINEYLEHYSDFLKESQENHITFTTGEYGLFIFNKILINSLGSNISPVNTSIIIPVEDQTNKEQFVTYAFPNNGKITLLHDPTLDAFDERNMDPSTGFPKKSSTLYFKEIK